MTEIEVTLFAASLLFLRFISLYFVIYVIQQQMKLWRRIKRQGIKETARLFRILLFALAVVMLLKNVVPVGIDIVAIASLGEVTLDFNSVSDNIIVHYFTSNAIFDLIMSAVIWSLYREARRYK